MSAPAWIDEVAWPAEGPPWLAMGLSRIQEAAWLLPDEHRDAERAQRADLLDHSRRSVFAAIEGTEAASAEVLALVTAWERDHAPALAGEPVDGSQHPLEAAGRRTQEDLVVMVPHADGYHLDAAVLCFPSHWRLLDKLGGSATAIHAPVPRYEEELADKVDRFLDRLRPDVIVARRNWSVHGDDQLHAGPARRSGPWEAVADSVATGERQRCAGSASGCVFTIRVQPPLPPSPHPSGWPLADRLDAPPGNRHERSRPHRDAVIARLRRQP